MAHITQSQNSVGTEGGAHVILSNKDRKAIKNAVEKLRKEGTPAQKVTTCECCGSVIRKTVPTSLASIAREVGVCRQNFYNYMKADKIELMTFLKIQNVLKCQILQDKEIKEYLSFLTSVLLPTNENVYT
tara:strand:- start:1168 stop:1557 length:390 start_codon:yes stop_codon:yes gene_type:complete